MMQAAFFRWANLLIWEVTISKGFAIDCFFCLLNVQYTRLEPDSKENLISIETSKVAIQL